MKKPNNYDNTKAFQERAPLPAGGYVCKIIDIAEMQSGNGRDMVKIALDVYEGEEAGRFLSTFEENTREDKKWPCVCYQLTDDQDGNANPRFKTFIESLEESNQGFAVEWGDSFCKMIKGKIIGVTFGREQYEDKQSGELRWTVKPRLFKSVEDIREGKFRIPSDRPFKKSRAQVPAGFTVIEDDDDDIPF